MMGLASNLDWTVFAVLVVVLLGIDIISRTWQAAAVRRAWMSSAAWIAVAIVFGLWKSREQRVR